MKGDEPAAKPITPFELKVLSYLDRTGFAPLGNKRIAHAAAMRRLEKKGFVVQGTSGRWFVSSAGRKLLAE